MSSFRVTIRCPHCQTRSIAISSREMSKTLREVTYRCTNELCGHTYVANLEVVRTLTVSSIPAPDVHLPLSPHVRREQLLLLLEDETAKP